MKTWLSVLCLVAAASIPAASTGRAAAVKIATFGCKTEADATTAMTLQAKRDLVGLENFTQPKIVSGDCVSFARGVVVSADAKKPPLTCVRLSGGLDCYWIAGSVIDDNPSRSDQAPSGGGRGRGRP
jgi:hypothetical protein